MFIEKCEVDPLHPHSGSSKRKVKSDRFAVQMNFLRTEQNNLVMSEDRSEMIANF